MFRRKINGDSHNSHLCSVAFSSENRASYMIIWKNAVETNSPQIAIQRMRFACWIIRVTHTHTLCITYCFFHGNNGFANAPPCYVIHCLSYLLMSDGGLLKPKHVASFTLFHVLYVTNFEKKYIPVSDSTTGMSHLEIIEYSRSLTSHAVPTCRHRALTQLHLCLLCHQCYVVQVLAYLTTLPVPATAVSNYGIIST